MFLLQTFFNFKKKYYPHLFDIIHGGKMVGRRRVKLSERFIGRSEFTVKMLPVVINRGAIRRRETLKLTWTGADATHNPYDIVVQVSKGELKDKTQGPQTCCFHLAFKIPCFIKFLRFEYFFDLHLRLHDAWLKLYSRHWSSDRFLF